MSGHVTPGHEAQSRGASASSALERWLLRQMSRLLPNPALGLQLWDGYGVRLPAAESVIVFQDRAALYQGISNPELAFGELYMAGRLLLRGDLVRAMENIYLAQAELQRRGGSGFLRAARSVVGKRKRANTLSGSRRNIHAHYDLGNDFYRLWLDRDHMQYTCAYYPQADVCLEAAQAAKLELVCRKLALKPGERVVEAGSGWGGLARYLARHYGVTVRSYNISAEQVAYARAKAQEEGLADRIEYVEDDYRNIDGTYDAFVSVGMLEHVGVRHYGELGDTINRCLTDQGRGLIHSIGQDEARPLNQWIESRIFPGAEPPTLGQMVQIFRPLQFYIMDVDNLRPHYAKTLQHWHERFEAEVETVERMFDPAFVRMWRLYLCGSIAAFTVGRLQLFQVLFRRPASESLPETREHLFREPFPSVAVDATSPAVT
jgi:cyclopropane-fatty-acyl-phospholipid synthase